MGADFRVPKLGRKNVSGGPEFIATYKKGIAKTIVLGVKPIKKRNKIQNNCTTSSIVVANTDSWIASDFMTRQLF